MTDDDLSRRAGQPTHEALWPANLFTQGIGWVIIARFKSAAARVQAGVFLIDVFCLGVKLALYEDCDVDDYRQRIRDHYLSNLPMVGTAPCCARKVVEQALHYAQGSGFAPHPDYKEAHESLEDCELRSVLKSSPLVTRASLSIGAAPGKLKSKPAALCGICNNAVAQETLIT